MKIISGLKDLWCDWTHGGGYILRDPSGRVNWQCMRCGRWVDPISLEDEARVFDNAVKNSATQPNPPA